MTSALDLKAKADLDNMGRRYGIDAAMREQLANDLLCPIVPSIPHIPTEVLHALQQIREDYPDAFIAGGYLRDLIHGKPSKDLDIFTFCQPRPDEVICPPNRIDYPLDRLFGIGERGFPDLPPIQLVFCKPVPGRTNEPETIVSMFALNFQQIFSPNGTDIRWLVPFQDALNTKQVQMVFCESVSEAVHMMVKIGNKDLAGTLSARYPEYTFDTRGIQDWISCNQEPTEDQIMRMQNPEA